MAHKWARWLAAWGVPTASERGAESEVAHKWSKMLYSGSVRCAEQTLPPKKGGGVQLCENPTFA